MEGVLRIYGDDGISDCICREPVSFEEGQIREYHICRIYGDRSRADIDVRHVVWTLWHDVDTGSDISDQPDICGSGADRKDRQRACATDACCTLCEHRDNRSRLDRAGQGGSCILRAAE